MTMKMTHKIIKYGNLFSGNAWDQKNSSFFYFVFVPKTF